MRHLRQVISIAAALLSGSAFAETSVMPFYLSSERFLAVCRASESECTAYVIGIVDTTLAINASLNDAITICIPESVAARELVELAVNAVDKNKIGRQLSPSATIAVTIAKRYPCRE